MTYVPTYLPLTVNIPKLLSEPIKFSPSQIYMPASDDCKFMIVSKLVNMRPFIEINTLYLLVSDALLKIQLIPGTGSPVALQVNVTESVSFSSISVTASLISAWTTYVYINNTFKIWSRE